MMVRLGRAGAGKTLVWLPPPFFLFFPNGCEVRYRYNRSRSVSIVLWYGGLCGVSVCSSMCIPYRTGIGMSERDGARVDDVWMGGQDQDGGKEGATFCHVELVFGIELNWSGAPQTAIHPMILCMLY